MLTRLPDWVARFEAYLRDNARREFVYGSWDCCLFAAGAIEAMTGIDPAAAFRDGRYATRHYGLVLLDAAGGVEGVLTAAGMAEVPVKMARRGDVVAFDPDTLGIEEAPLLGIVALNGREALVIGEQGLRAVPLAKARKAWRV